jgi:phospholipase C
MLKGAIMELKSCRVVLAACLALAFLPGTTSASDLKRNLALQNLKHIIVVMQENHSFDNYFGALAYMPGGVYHWWMPIAITTATVTVPTVRAPIVTKAAAAPTTIAASTA